MTLGDRGPFGVVLRLGRVAGLLIWKGSQNRTIIYKGLTVTRFFGGPILGACGSPWMQCCFRRFFVLHSRRLCLYLIRMGSGGGGCCLSSSPSRSRCLRPLGHFFCALHVCHGFTCGLVPVSVGWLGCFWGCRWEQFECI